MNLYSVYIDNKNQVISPTIIRQGFSVWPVILNFIWAVYYRMWMVVVPIMVLTVIVAGHEVWKSLTLVFQFLLFAFFAPELREFQARKRGLVLTDVILARSMEEAELKYLTRQ